MNKKSNKLHIETTTWTSPSCSGIGNHCGAVLSDNTKKSNYLNL